METYYAEFMLVESLTVNRLPESDVKSKTFISPTPFSPYLGYHPAYPSGYC